MGADIWPKIPPNTEKHIRLIGSIGPKVWDIIEKEVHWVSIVGAGQSLLHLNSIVYLSLVDLE